jgi:DNA-binding response OmpR family regulator
MANSPLAEPVVWIIDSEHWPRACLRAELIERGIDAIGCEEFTDAISMLQNPWFRRPDLAVLDLKNQNLNSADLDRWRRYQIPLIVLAGSAELSQDLFQELQWAHILRRPISIGQIADTVMQDLGKFQTE